MTEISAEQLKGLTFSEMKKEIQTMDLAKLEEFVSEFEKEAQIVPPKPLPFAGLATLGGVISFLVGLSNPIFMILGLVLVTYGLAAGNINQTRASQYRLSCYRLWVEKQALEID